MLGAVAVTVTVAFVRWAECRVGLPRAVGDMRQDAGVRGAEAQGVRAGGQDARRGVAGVQRPLLRRVDAVRPSTALRVHARLVLRRGHAVYRPQAPRPVMRAGNARLVAKRAGSLTLSAKLNVERRR